MKKLAISAIKSIASVTFWIVVWLLISLFVNDSLLLPSPISVFKVLLGLVQTLDFWKAVLKSLLNVASGVVISFMIGGILAYLMSASKIMNSLFSPLLSVIKATPVASFIVIAFLWFSISALPSFIATLIVIPIVTSNIMQGINAVKPELKDVAKIYQFSPVKKLLKLYVPSVLPYFLAACKSSLGMAWKACIAAEMIVFASGSIGEKLHNSKTYFEFDDAFAWTLVTVILSVCLEKLIIFVLDRLGRRLKAVSRGDDHAQA